MHPRRVLHVSMPTTAGVPTVLLGYVRDQVARGWTVEVACPSDGWLATGAAAAGARVLPWAARRSPGPATWGETRRLAAVIADRNPDVVHLHSSKAGLAGRLAVRGRLATVFQPHAWSFLAVDGLTRAATVRWERFGARWTDALLLVSEAERAVGAGHGIAGPSWVVPNGVDCIALTPAGTAERAAARRSLGLADGPFAVCVGRLSEQKGQCDLLAAWPDVRRRVAGAELVLVGDGPDRARLEELDVAGVRFVGERDDVADWLAAATVVVAPSRWEGMALAPLEASARARAVVATDVAGVREALPTGAGAVVAVADVPGLGRAVADRLADPDAADAEGRLGRAHVEAHHDASAAAEAVVRVYEAVLGSRR